MKNRLLFHIPITNEDNNYFDLKIKVTVSDLVIEKNCKKVRFSQEV